LRVLSVSKMGWEAAKLEMMGVPDFVCPECSRVFDMFNEKDVEEWSFGHDCEASQFYL